MTGGSTWLPGLLSTLPDGGNVNVAAIQAGIARARYMLQNAAELEAAQQGAQLMVTVENNCGQKLPTGYPEGRRMWINVRFFDETAALIAESAAYDPATGVLDHDGDAKIYEVKPGLDSITAPLAGEPEGPSFHFVLNNKVYKDNRIPPRGFTNANYERFGGAPVAHSYADGQYWDDTFYAIPVGAVSAEVTLYYHSTSKEFAEFLRDENTTDSSGQDMYDLWSNNGKCPPEMMAQTQVGLTPVAGCTTACGDFDVNGTVNLTDFSSFALCFGLSPASNPECVCMDLDGNGSVNLGDFATFANLFGTTTTNVPPNCL